MQRQSIFDIYNKEEAFILHFSNIQFANDVSLYQNSTNVASSNEENYVSKNLFCSSCNVKLVDREDQILHYKSDWHRFNIKLKLRKLETITELQFQDITDNFSSISSISGSESEEDSNLDVSIQEEHFPNESPFDVSIEKLSGVEDSLREKLIISSIVEENKFTSLKGFNIGVTNVDNNLLDQKEQDCDLIGENAVDSKCYLLEDTNSRRLYILPLFFLNTQLATEMEIVNNFLIFLKNEKWAIFMGSSGHFAAAIFLKDEMIHHKTFHRYVVRAKRGMSQGKYDSQGRNAKSVGASLRRHNEKALLQDIINLVKSWSEELNGCGKIFLRAPAPIRKAIFSAQTQNRKTIIERSDWRLSYVPVPTRRPTLKEIKRVHQVLSTITYYDCTYESYLINRLKESTAASKKSNNSPIQTADNDPQPGNDILIVEDNLPIKINESNEEANKRTTVDSHNGADLSETEMALVWNSMEFDTSDLKMFDSSKTKRRRKKKKVPTATLR